LYDRVVKRGWGGDPPRDDDEARARVVEAAKRCIQRHGPRKTGLSDVAQELGVTRQTVYRLYATTEELLLAVAAAGADEYLDRLAEHVAGLTDPTEIVVESIAHTVERLPREPVLGLLLATGRADLFARGVTSAGSMVFARTMLDRLPVDWAAIGYDDVELDGLAEFGLRVLQSMVLDPPGRRNRGDLRAWLRRWVGPAVQRGHRP
jgi:AcrR family transcriptional regulator